MGKIRVLTIRIPDEKRAELDDLSRRTGLTVCSLVRSGIYRLIEEGKAKTAA